MYENHQKFLAWAAAYDCGDIHMRSKAKHDEWGKLLQCKQIVAVLITLRNTLFTRIIQRFRIYSSKRKDKIA